MLYKEIVELITKARDLQTYSENYRKQLWEMRQALKQTPKSNRWTIKLPDPPLFDGSSKDGITFDKWLIQVKNKLYGNADLYPTEDLKIIYIARHTSGKALALISL